MTEVSSMGAFAGPVRTLGLRPSGLHAAFVTPTDDEAFFSETASAEEVAGWAEGKLDESGRTLSLLHAGPPTPEAL